MEVPTDENLMGVNELKKSEVKIYAEENLKEFEDIRIKLLSALPCWNKIRDFFTSNGISRIDNLEIILASGGKQWESVFGSNDSKSSYKPMTIILKKEIFDNENISEEDESWLVHEIGHIKFYQDLGDNLDDYMEEYHKQGKYADSDMEKYAFELQYKYLNSIGKARNECIDVIKNYLDKAFSSNQKEENEYEYKKLIGFLENNIG